MRNSPSVRLARQYLQDFAQLLERFLILRAHRRLVLAARISPLKLAEHGACDRDRVTPMVGFANEIEFRQCLHMTGETVQSKTVVDVGEAALVDLRAFRRHVDIEELSFASGRVETLGLLDHHCIGHQRQLCSAGTQHRDSGPHPNLPPRSRAGEGVYGTIPRRGQGVRHLPPTMLGEGWDGGRRCTSSPHPR
jgi:hypothetical protein